MVYNYASLTCPLLPRSQFFVLFSIAKFLAHPEIPFFPFHPSFFGSAFCFQWTADHPPFCTIQTHSYNLLLYPASLNSLEEFKMGVLNCHSGPPCSTLQIDSFVLRTKKTLPQLQFGEMSKDKSPLDLKEKFKPLPLPSSRFH